MYNFPNLTDKERRSFVPEYEKNIFCARVNDTQKSMIFDNKWETYKTFKSFFKRDVCYLDNISDLDSKEFATFIEKHPQFIVKPVFSASGSGIHFFDVTVEKEIKNIIANLFKSRAEPLLLEELIIQNDEMGAFHKESVNTLRVRTFRFDDRVELLPSNMRLGRGNSRIDNTGKGGISVALDENGCAIAACDELGERFVEHPDSKKQIIGFVVPKWKEAIAFAKEMAQVVPEVRYVGWDLALTDDGWVLIEGNDKGMFVGIQKPLQKGFREQMNRILQEMQIKL